jgi:hypothetical protein
MIQKCEKALVKNDVIARAEHIDEEKTTELRN